MDYDYLCNENNLKEMSIEQLLLEFREIFLESKTTFKYSEKSLMDAMEKIEKEIYLRTTT